MNLIEVNRADYNPKISPRGEPIIRFERRGLVRINKAAVKHLGLSLDGNNCLAIFHGDDEDKNKYVVRAGKEGWKLRKGFDNALEFCCAQLSKEIITATWNSHGHAVGTDYLKPKAYSLHVSLFALDGDKNKDVFALIRKKV